MPTKITPRHLVGFELMLYLGKVIYGIFEEDIIYDDWCDFYLASFC